MNSPSKTVVLFASDLMLSSTVSGFAASAGVKFQSADDISSLQAAVAGADETLLLMDIGLPGFSAGDVAMAVPGEVLERAIAYGPHVHTEKLQAAENAGIGTVISRGRFSSQIGQLISAFAAE